MTFWMGIFKIFSLVKKKKGEKGGEEGGRRGGGRGGRGEVNMYQNELTSSH